MPKGGKREGAGRKTIFTHSRKLALANEVTLLQRQNPKLTISDALGQLENEGLIRPHTRARYLTPQYINAEILTVLTECDREGILTLLPRLSKDDPL